MTITTTILLLLALHFVGDFLCQSDWMAINKSKRWGVLALHCAIYAALFFFMPNVGPRIFVFIGVTFATHFVTDAVTSRITSALWFIMLYPRTDYSPVYYGAYPFYARVIDGRRHWFFVVIGADQLIHVYTLILTWQWLFPAVRQ